VSEKSYTAADTARNLPDAIRLQSCSALPNILGAFQGGIMTVDNSTREKWVLILGASSGFGAAASLALARSGYHVFGVHLDRRATLAAAERVLSDIHAMNQRAIFFNVNAADPIRRAEVIQRCREEIGEPSRGGCIEVLLHSLAFGTLKPYISSESEKAIRTADMNMTLDVMAHSLVYWVQDLYTAGMLREGAKIFAMTSAGGHRVWPGYGAVSAAKAALEAHVRQLAVELAPYGISANALRAGVTDTPAARKIPGSDRMFAQALAFNPGRRLTTPDDVARAIVALVSCDSNWMTGNVLGIDGGEDLAG
jgi:NAD(P)-dependent dehydrogenase (short-subunit alcohol dehydrogenase family)